MTKTLWTRVLMISTLMVVGIFAQAEDFYWVNGEGSWNDFANHWSKTSGNSGGVMQTHIPTSSDNVFFNAQSFPGAIQNQRVMLTGTPAYCNNMDWTGATNNPKVLGSQPLYIYGSLTFIQNMIFDIGAPTYFSSLQTASVTTAGNTIPVAAFFEGQGGHWNLQDDLKVDGNLSLNWGQLTTNNHAITCFRFNSKPTDVSNLRYLDLGNSLLTIALADDNVNSIFSCNICLLYTSPSPRD